ncbi:MAG: hypothetical protein ACO1OQ_12010 [Rufibacter sp.]
MDDNSILPDWVYKEESLTELQLRYSGFGKDLYKVLEERLPEVFSQLKFYQSVESQTEDSFATFNDGSSSFGIQLDPLIEVIVIWDKEHHFEISSRVENAYETAIDLIRTTFLKKNLIRNKFQESWFGILLERLKLIIDRRLA